MGICLGKNERGSIWVVENKINNHTALRETMDLMKFVFMHWTLRSSIITLCR